MGGLALHFYGVYSRRVQARKNPVGGLALHFYGVYSFTK